MMSLRVSKFVTIGGVFAPSNVTSCIFWPQGEDSNYYEETKLDRISVELHEKRKLKNGSSYCIKK